MNAGRVVRQSGLALLIAVFAGFALAQAPSAKPEYKPSVGQAGKDVIWVPTPQPLVDKMLDMAKVTAGDYVVDLGSGDGRTVITAAKRGARALGIEYNPDMVALSKRAAAAEGVSDKASFVQADIFKSDFSRATVITMFLLSDLNLKLRPTILSLKSGTRVVSNTFRMGDWEPDETSEVDCGSYCTAYFWVVPAKVEGTWHSAQGDFNLKQNFQMLSGTLKSGPTLAPISKGRLRGDQITITAGDAEFTGRVDGNSIEGTVRTGANIATWKARH